MGLALYVTLLQEIVEANPDVDIIAIEDLPISSRITIRRPDRQATLAAIAAILDHHGYKQVVVIGHSYGTVTAAHMLRDPAWSGRLAASILIDPISLLLFMPDLTYNFVYREPRRMNELMLAYFVCRDPDIARAVQRGFFFSDSALWKEDLVGRRVGIVLAGRDQLVDAPEMWQYLTTQEVPCCPMEKWESGPLEVAFFSQLDHCETFIDAQARRTKVDMISRFVRRKAE